MFDSIDRDKDGGWLDDLMSGSMEYGGAAMKWAGDLAGAVRPIATGLKTLGGIVSSEEAVSAAAGLGDFYTDFRGSRGPASADTTDAAYLPGAAPTVGMQAREAVGGDVADGIFTAAGGLDGALAGATLGVTSGAAPMAALAGMGAGTSLGGLAGGLGGAAVGGLGSAATGGLTGAAIGSSLGALFGPLGILAGGALGGLGGAASSGMMGALGGGLLGSVGGSLAGSVLGTAGGGAAGVLLPALGGGAIGAGLANPNTNPFEMWAD